MTLSEAQAHQLRHVLRLETGAIVALFNGRDGEWLGAATIEKRGASVRIMEQTRSQSIAPDLWLAFAPLKQDRMGFLVEKASELGVAKLLPVTTARTQGGSRVNVEKLTHAVREAAEQCERLDVPQLVPPQSLKSLLENWDHKRRLFVCAERGQAQPVLAAFEGHKGPAAILIGPEGGFTPEEFARLAGYDFVTPVTLGPIILRAETAAIAALACWQAKTLGSSALGAGP